MKRTIRILTGAFFIGVLSLNYVSNSTEGRIDLSLDKLIQTVAACGGETTSTTCNVCGSGTSSCTVTCNGTTTQCSNTKGIETD